MGHILIKLGWLIRSAILSALVGVASGACAWALFKALVWATALRQANLWLVWGLPVAGLISGLAYHAWGREAGRGSNLIIDEIHQPVQSLPWMGGVLVFLATVLTHLFGGSAGREGTVVQVSATLADQIRRVITVTAEERKRLLIAGVSAGFAVAVDAPWAGMVFGIEVLTVGRFGVFGWFQALVAAQVSRHFGHFLGMEHLPSPQVAVPYFELSLIPWVLVAGLVFGLSGRIFVLLTHGVSSVFSKVFRYPPLRPFLGGVLLVLLFQLEGSTRFMGLGIETIQGAFAGSGKPDLAPLKGVFSALTVGSGLRGGEYVPLVFIGATTGSFLSSLIPVATPLLTALGFVSVFAGAANTPIACTILAVELFGGKVAVYALLACLMSFAVSGKSGIYPSQRRGLPGPQGLS